MNSGDSHKLAEIGAALIAVYVISTDMDEAYFSCEWDNNVAPLSA